LSQDPCPPRRRADPIKAPHQVQQGHDLGVEKGLTTLPRGPTAQPSPPPPRQRRKTSFPPTVTRRKINWAGKCSVPEIIGGRAWRAGSREQHSPRLEACRVIGPAGSLIPLLWSGQSPASQREGPQAYPSETQPHTTLTPFQASGTVVVTPIHLWRESEQVRHTSRPQKTSLLAHACGHAVHALTARPTGPATHTPLSARRRGQADKPPACGSGRHRLLVLFGVCSVCPQHHAPR
jgi:hypothetical protein